MSVVAFFTSPNPSVEVLTTYPSARCIGDTNMFALLNKTLPRHFAFGITDAVVGDFLQLHRASTRSLSRRGLAKANELDGGSCFWSGRIGIDGHKGNIVDIITQLDNGQIINEWVGGIPIGMGMSTTNTGTRPIHGRRLAHHDLIDVASIETMSRRQDAICRYL